MEMFLTLFTFLFQSNYLHWHDSQYGNIHNIIYTFRKYLNYNTFWNAFINSYKEFLMFLITLTIYWWTPQSY